MRRGVVVLGGNGYVGSAVCRRAVRSAAIPCTSVTRSGPPTYYQSWMKEVKWERGDASKLHEHKELLSQAAAVISCVGAFGSNEFMERTCGDLNVAAMKAAKEAGVPRFVYISAHQFPGMSMLIPGYVRGKLKAEAALAELYGRQGAALRPTMVYGTRRVKGLPLPLGIVGVPLAFLAKTVPAVRRLPLLGPYLAPPVCVESVAQVALQAAVDESISGVVEVDEILRLTQV